MLPNFERFIRERQYLQNVSPRTLEWYRNSLRLLPCEAPTQQQLNDAVIQMRERGLKATGCNCKIRAINAYLKWAGQTERIRKLQEPQLILPTFSDPQIKKLIAWKPDGDYERRLHALVLFMLDTGCRISEALGLHVRDVDMDNLLVTLDGKGAKQRIVPISFELRKTLVRFRGDTARKLDSLLFPSHSQTELSRNNCLRDVKRLCRELGFAPPCRTLHSFRHTFATSYLRRGGSLLHLQKVLGHSSLEMTKRYVHLSTVDLQAAHERLSLLSK